MENGINFYLKNTQSDTITHTHNQSVIEPLFSNEHLHIGRYALPKDTFLYTSAASGSNSVKSYTVLSGRIMELRTKAILTTGDVFVVDSKTPVHTFYNLEDTSLLFHEQTAQTLHNVVKSSNEMVALLNDLQMKDHYTKEHCDRVYHLAKGMGLALNYHSKEMYNLNKASRFHDIGKIQIDDGILNKPDALTSDEFELMKAHTEHCKTLIIEKFDQEVFKIISQHHERLDGSGYPNGLKAPDICEAAKILAICDSFDAMTTDRIYKKGKSKEEAFEELRDLSDTHYDRPLVDLFIQIYHDLPPHNNTQL